jgi:hydroxyacylglutathione hydrolase
MIEISQFEGITRFKMGTELDGEVFYWCSAYQVDELLIDSGCAHTAKELLEALEGRGIKMVVNTHHHEDHIGANALLAEKLGVELFAPGAALQRIAKQPELFPHQELLWGRAQRSLPHALGEEISTSGHRLQVIPMPGHSDDLVVFWEPKQRWAFVSDLWLLRHPKTCRNFENNLQALTSLQRLKAMRPRVMFTGLGDIEENAVEALVETIDWLEQCRDRAVGLAEGGMAPGEIVQEMFGRESAHYEMTQGQFSYEHFVRSFLKGP